VDYAVAKKTVEVPLRGVAAGLWNATLNRGKGLWDALSLLSHGAARVTEEVENSRQDLEAQLKTACEALIALHTQQLVGDLLAFFEEVAKQGSATSVQTAPAVLRALLAKLTSTPAEQSLDTGELKQRDVCALEINLSAVLARSHLYLDNPVTEKILFRPVKV
jgi:hypothetical protein